MFCSGIEVRSTFAPGEKRTAMAITILGTWFSRRPRGRGQEGAVPSPFGAGPRICIGQSFAVTEMALVQPATMLQRCGVERIDLEEPAMHVTMAVRPKESLTLRWTRRAK